MRATRQYLSMIRGYAVSSGIAEGCSDSDNRQQRRTLRPAITDVYLDRLTGSFADDPRQSLLDALGIDQNAGGREWPLDCRLRVQGAAGVF